MYCSAKPLPIFMYCIYIRCYDHLNLHCLNTEFSYSYFSGGGTKTSLTYSSVTGCRIQILLKEPLQLISVNLQVLF